MILKINMVKESVCVTIFVLFGFYWIWGILPDQASAKFLIEPVELTGLARFLKEKSESA